MAEAVEGAPRLRMAQLAAAGLDALIIEVPPLTASNYAAVLDDLIALLDPAVIDKTI